MIDLLHFLHDRVLLPALWLLFPGERRHRRELKVQTAHLRYGLHATPDPDCWYCQGLIAWRAQHPQET